MVILNRFPGEQLVCGIMAGGLFVVPPPPPPPPPPDEIFSIKTPWLVLGLPERLPVKATGVTSNLIVFPRSVFRVV